MVLTKFCHSYDDTVCILKANCLKLKEVAKTKSKILKHPQYPPKLILVCAKIKISSVTKTTLENTHNLYTCIIIVI